MKLEEVKALLEKWQKILRIQDWDIEVQLVSPNKLTTGEQGEILIHRKYKRALIKLVDVKFDWPRDDFDLHYNNPNNPDYLEHSLVHELVHIVVYKFETEFEEEQIVEQITKALMFLGAERHD